MCESIRRQLHGTGVLKEVGVRGIEIINVENACAGGATSFRGVWKEIASGHDVSGIAMGVESMTTSPIVGKLIPPEKSDLEGHMGMTMPGMFAMVARRQMEFGATVEDFALVSVKNHHNGCLNPAAQYKKEFTIEEVLKSRMIADPITLLMCCPNTDGAAAAILCSMDMARKYTTKPVRILASAFCSADYKYDQEDICCIRPWVSRWRKWHMKWPGSTGRISIWSRCMTLSPTRRYFRYEDLMLCKPGEGLIFSAQVRRRSIGGRIPVNPSGGLLALGHPSERIGSSHGMRSRPPSPGPGGARQTPNAKVGLAQMLGGLVTNLEHGAVAGIHILAR